MAKKKLTVTDEPYSLPDLTVGQASPGEISKVTVATPTPISGTVEASSPAIGSVSNQPWGNYVQQSYKGIPTGTSTGVLGASTTTGTTGGGVGGTTDFSSLRAGILSSINELTSIYSSLYGQMGEALEDQRRIVEEGVGRQINETNVQRERALEGTKRVMASRGMADSSFNAEAQGDVNRQADSLVQGYERAGQESLADMGRYAEEKSAAYRADEVSLQRTMQELDGITDEYQLLMLRDKLNDKLGTLKVEQAGFGTEEGFVGKLNSYTPDLGFQRQLDTLATDASATSDEKMQIAKRYLSMSGMDQEEQDFLYNDFLIKSGILGTEEEA